MALMKQPLNELKRPERIEKRRRAYMATTRQVDPERGRIFTKSYQENQLDPVSIRRAKAFAKFLAEKTIVIHEDELIIGSKSKYLRGCLTYPELSASWIKGEMDGMANRADQVVISTPEDRAEVVADAEYWIGGTVQDKIWTLWRENFGEEYFNAIKAGLVLDVSFESYGRVVVDYGKALSLGIGGIISEVEQELAKTRSDTSIEAFEKREFLTAMKISLEAVINYAHRHALFAEELAFRETNEARRKELTAIAKVCQWVPENPPRSFHEAVQSFWFIHLAMQIENDPHGLSPGRFDQYMYPYYKKDMDAGVITREQAKELLECMYVKMTELERLFPNSHVKAYHSRYQNVMIGGSNPDGSDSTNDLSYLILEAQAEARMTQPTISIRYHDATPKELMLRAAELVRTGIGMPAFFNGKVAYKLLLDLGLPSEEAYDWGIGGCVDMHATKNALHQADGGFVNCAKCLELALNNGVDPVKRMQVGPETGDPHNFKTYEDLYEAFKKQLQYAVEMNCAAANLRLDVSAKYAPLTYASALVGGCIASGKDTMAGGAKYNQLLGHTINAIIDTADSLTALRKIVYEDKSLSLDQVLTAVAANFEGYEDVRHKLRKAPKYGNDDDYADNTARTVYAMCLEETTKYPTHLGYPWLLNGLSVTTHYHFGTLMGALPNGRLATTPLTDGSLSPSVGNDKHGPTAVINSASKVITPIASKVRSTLLNQKFHPSALSSNESLEKLEALIRTHFDNMAHHIQFNVVSGETLRAAQKDPEAYTDLIVRIAGFSVFFVDLARSVQDEVIARTEFQQL